MTDEQLRLEKAICQLRYEYDKAIEYKHEHPSVKYDALEFALFLTQQHYMEEKE